jgi:hypothetical protein
MVPIPSTVAEIKALWQRVTPGALWHWFAPGVVAVMLAAAVIMVCDHRAPRTVESYTIVPSPVRPGDDAELVLTATDHRACEGRTVRWIVDSKGARYALTDHDQAEDKFDLEVKRSIVRELPIPKTIAEGPATYHVRLERWCNPAQEYIWPMVDYIVVPFTVAK